MVVLALVAALAVAYRLYGSPTTGTGTLTLPPPAPAPHRRRLDLLRRSSGGRKLLPLRTGYLRSRLLGELELRGSLSYYSKQSEPYFRGLARDFGREGVRFAAVYIDDPPEEDAGSLPYAVVWDQGGRLASLYNVKRVPRLFVVKDGTVLMTYDDLSPEAYEEVRKTLGKFSQPSS
jgi:hypothetical protein